MEIVGQKYEKKGYYPPQVQLSARTLHQALDVALPKLDKVSAGAQGKVVMAVVEGDVHDIGKNIVMAMLTGTVLTIFDLGRDIPVKNIVDKAKAENAMIIATPILMTPTLAGMKGDREDDKEGNPRPKIKTLIGGGVTPRNSPTRLEAMAGRTTPTKWSRS